MKCTYAHRMRTTRGHAPITDVLAAGGMDVFVRLQRESVTAAQRSLYTMSQDTEARFQENRKKNLSKIQSRKDQRRFGHAKRDADGFKANNTATQDTAIKEEEEGETNAETSSSRNLKVPNGKEKIWEAAVDHYGPRRPDSVRSKDQL
jgi:hypothetical protein